MLTRRHLRIKVMQSLYSFIKKEKKDISAELLFLELSIKNAFSLYVLLLSYLKALYDFSMKRKADSKKMKILVIKDKYKFIIENDVLKFISEHKTLSKFISKIKTSNWEVNNDYVISNYEKLLESTFFLNHIQKINNLIFMSFSFKFYKKIIVESENFFDYIEDSQIT